MTRAAASDRQPRSLKSHPLVQLVDEVARLQGRLQSVFAEVQQGSGLKTMEDLVLNAIVEADHPPTVPQIGRSLGHPRQVIQRAVNSLLEEGYLEKQPNPDHKRAPIFTLTGKGQTLKQRSDVQALEIADAFLERIAGQRCEELALGLKEVRRAMEAFARERPSNTNGRRG